MLTMFTKNYTGVYDLYNPQQMNAYPCFDSLTNDCGGFAGTDDITEVTVQREGLTSISKFKRLLICCFCC